MKPPDRYPPEDPREWLNRAQGNLSRAKNFLPDFYLEDLCFDAQQAAEKINQGRHDCSRNKVSLRP